MKKKIVKLAAMLVLLGWSAPAGATLIEIALTAEVKHVDDRDNLLEGKIQVDDIITGVYRYDSETPDSNPSDTIGDYWINENPYGIHLNINDLNFHTNGEQINCLIEIANNHLESFDKFEFISYNNFMSNSMPVELISWALIDYDQNAIQNDNLFISSPNLSLDWEVNKLIVENIKNDIFKIESNVIDAYVIPEPSSVLLILGSFGLLRFRRFK